MKYLNYSALPTITAVAAGTYNGPAIDASQLINASFQSIITGTCTVTVKIQASNDSDNAGYIAAFTPTNWIDIPLATATGSVAALLSLVSMSYRWVRVVVTCSANTGTATVTVNMNAQAV